MLSRLAASRPGPAGQSVEGAVPAAEGATSTRGPARAAAAATAGAVTPSPDSLLASRAATVARTEGPVAAGLGVAEPGAVPAAGAASPPEMALPGNQAVASPAGQPAPTGSVAAERPGAAPPAAEHAAAAPPAAERPGAGSGGPDPEQVGPAAAPPAEELLAATVAVVSDRARQQRSHRPAATLVASAGAAAIEPSVEQQRSASSRTVEGMDADPEQVRRDAFKAALRQAIQDATPEPKTEGEAERVMRQGADTASQALSGQLNVQSEAAAGPIRSAAQTEISPDSQPAPPAAELDRDQAGPAPGPVPAGAVVPEPLPPEQLDYSGDRASTDQALADAGVSAEQLERGNEGEFQPALEARSAAEAHEEAAPTQYRESEAELRADARASATSALAGGLAGMHESRGQVMGRAAETQTSTSSKQRADRRRVTADITQIQVDTKADVEKILTAMDEEAASIFADGLARAESAYDAAFEDAKGGLGTWLTTWGSDWDRHIERSLAKARSEYLRHVEKAIDAVADCVDGKLQAAKNRVAEGRAAVKAYVSSLDEGLASVGEQARQAVSGEFDALEGAIDQRRDSLIDRLTQQYKDSYQRMSAREEQLRQENKSLWQRVYDATVGVIKKIIEFRNMLLSVLAKAASVIALIIGDPIGFLGNLVAAAKQGVISFSENIVEHLRKGLIEWLFGAVAKSAIQLPKTFDLKGILSLVLQILGLTWANIRRIAVEMVGEPIVKTLEKLAEPIVVLIRDGPAGLWEWIKEKLTDLKAMLLDEIQSWLVTNVIKAGITWIISLLNPASAFLKACKAIYDIVMFFVERASQIAELVSAITDSIGAIAQGSIAGAAKKVEAALAKSIPVAIGLLAGLLGLGDIGGAIKRFIDRVRAPVEDAIRWLINKAVTLVKAAGKMLGLGKKDEPDGADGDPRALAHRSIVQGVSSGMPDSSVRDHLAKTRQDLKPAGLTGLELRGPQEDGTYDVYAAASEFKKLLTLVPADLRGTRSVTMEVTFELREAIDLDAVQNLGRHRSAQHDPSGQLRMDETGQPVLETTHYSMDPDPTQTVGSKTYRGSRPGPKTRSGGVVAPLDTSDGIRLRVLTYNTGDEARVDSNRTHAEAQLESFLSGARDVARRVVAIEAHINYSPCTLCTPDMQRIAALTPNAERRTLTYTKWYTHQKRGTTATSLAAISAAGWSVVGPGAPGGGSDPMLAVEGT